MEQDLRKSLGERLDIVEIEYEIKKFSLEVDYHKSKSRIFEQTIKEWQRELDARGVTPNPFPKGEFYQ
ncbi:MAG: hypothetical protein JW390_10010 [Nitrosopumilus sp.]|nr:hypothetical protein [Candidatus Nitrosopumilus limneticus]